MSLSSAEERSLLLSPIVPENIAHNTKVITNIRSLTSSILGIAAGILGLESYVGFVFYLVGSALVGAALAAVTGEGRFRSKWDVWTLEVFGGSSLSGFVLTWTLFYNLVRS